MNWNAIRTFILGSGILTVALPHLISWMTTLLGCSGDNPLTPDLELTVCTGGALIQIPLWLQATIATIVLSALGLIKGVMGSGTFMQNLFSKSVPVVPAVDAKPGVVTATQVASDKS